MKKALVMVSTFAAASIIASKLSAETILLTDSFNTSTDANNTYPNNDVNTGITTGNPNPGRQGGTLAPLGYTSSNTGGLVQVGSTNNPNALQLTQAGGNGQVSPNHDFAGDVSLGQSLHISFDVDPVATGSDPNAAISSWASINFLTAHQDEFVNQTNGGVGFLIRGNGGTEAFGTNNADVPISGLSSGGEHHIDVYLAPTATGYNISAFADGSATAFFSYAATGTFTHDYISLGGDQDNGSFATVQTFDNLSIGVTPEPSSLALCGFGAAGLLARKRRRRGI